MRLKEAREIAARAPIPPGLKSEDVASWRSLYARFLYRAHTGRWARNLWAESASWYVDIDRELAAHRESQADLIVVGMVGRGAAGDASSSARRSI